MRKEKEVGGDGFISSLRLIGAWIMNKSHTRGEVECDEIEGHFML
jgi:hypothetical protein